MHNRFILSTVLGFGVVVAAFAQAAEPPALGPMADVLQNRVGNWNVEIRFQPAPGARAVTSKATETSRLIAGKWLLSEFRGEMAGRPFAGVGLNSYDARSGKYVGIWTDNASGSIVPVEGRYDPEGRKFTTVSQEMTPNGRQDVTEVTRTIDSDTEETTLFAPGPDGKSFARMTMRLTRAK